MGVCRHGPLFTKETPNDVAPIRKSILVRTVESILADTLKGPRDLRGMDT